MAVVILRLHLRKHICRFVRSYGSYRINKLSNNVVVIVAAVRTPTVNWLEEQQLTGFVIDEVVKRSTVPRDEFKALIACTTSEAVDDATLKGITKNLGLTTCEAFQIFNKSCSICGLQMTLKKLQDGNIDCAILYDTRYHTEANCGEIQVNQGYLTSEFMDVNVARPKKQTYDSIKQAIDGKVQLESAALALTTHNFAKRFNLEPLARIREFILDKSIQNSLSRLQMRQKIQPSDVHSWNIATSQKEKSLQLKLLTKLRAQNICFHDMNTITVSHLLTHLTHILPNGSYGSALIQSAVKRYMLVMLEKLVPEAAKKSDLPLLTLYTKDPCPLCDELVAKLESNFSGSYKLLKIFIDRKENVRFLRLYRHDIPVLFINGQFLCMHKLNEAALRDRLAALSKENN